MKKRKVRMARIAVAMSGGVDSSVAAWLLVEAGHEVVGLSMNVWDYERTGCEAAEGKSCCSPRDVEDARRICDHLGIPFYALNFRQAFQERVVQPFIDDYVAGRTPNPCVRCNDDLKFSLLWQRAQAVGAEFIATGHYSRLSDPNESGPRRLFRAIDSGKDQTYFLFGLRRPALGACLFPLGGMRKEEVRALAAKAGLRTAQKAESQDICFVREGSYADLVARDPRVATLGVGELVDTEGRVLGTHQGYWRYTIGQRRGLGFAAGERVFVVALDAVRNRVVIGPEEALFARALRVRELSLLDRERLEDGLPIRCQVRSRQVAQGARLYALEGRELAAGGMARVVFDEPQRALTTGQAAVFYQGEECLGGGWIDEVEGVGTD